MDVQTFRTRVLAVESMPQALLQYLAGLSENLEPKVREEILHHLEWGDEHASEIIDDASKQMEAIPDGDPQNFTDVVSPALAS